MRKFSITFLLVAMATLFANAQQTPPPQFSQFQQVDSNGNTNIYIYVEGSSATATVNQPAYTPPPAPYYPPPAPPAPVYYPPAPPQPVYVNQPCNNCGPANNGKMTGYEKGQLAMGIIGTLGNLGTNVWHEVNAQKGYYGTNVTYNPTTVIHNNGQTTPVPVTPVVIQPTDGYPTQGTGTNTGTNLPVYIPSWPSTTTTPITTTNTPTDGYPTPGDGSRKRRY